MGATVGEDDCSGQNESAGFLAYQGDIVGAYGPVILDHFDVDLQVNADQANSSCANPFAGLAATGTSQTGQITWKNSTAKLRSSEPVFDKEKLNGIITDSRHDVKLKLENVSVETTP
jgi:hypothetical protein